MINIKGKCVFIFTLFFLGITILILYLSYIKYEDWVSENIYIRYCDSNYSQMVQILFGINKSGKTNSILYFYYVNNYIVDIKLFISPFTPSLIYEKKVVPLEDLSEKSKLDESEFNELCGYIIKINNNCFEIWDRYNCSLGIKEMALSEHSPLEFKKRGCSILFYGAPLKSTLRKDYDDKYFPDIGEKWVRKNKRPQLRLY